MTRRLHRIFGLVLVTPLLVWVITGFLFLVKPGWRGAYEMLDAFRDEPVASDLSHVRMTDVRRAELGSTAIGPLAKLTVGSASTPVLADVSTGETLSPLTAERARSIAIDAASRSRGNDRYGAVLAVTTSGESVDVRFQGGATISVGRRDLSLTQRGRDTDLIDWLYRIHYLQWTGVKAIDRPFACLALAGMLFLAFAGVRLARKA